MLRFSLFLPSGRHPPCRLGETKGRNGQGRKLYWVDETKGVAMEKEFLRMKLAELVPYENNPRHNEEAVDATIASMQQCGNIDPIEVDEDNVILSGHTRRLALMKMGYEESDVIRVTGLTDLQKKKYRILANKTNEFAGWDFGKLEEELDGLDFEGFNFGFDVELTKEESPEKFEAFGGMKEKYLVPPFSVICSDKAEWQLRKREWTNKGIRSELGRGKDLLQLAGSLERQASYSKQKRGAVK